MENPNENPVTKGQNSLEQVPIEIRVSVGSAKPSVAELLALKRDSVLHIGKTLDEDVGLFIGEQLIGSGQLEETDENGTGGLTVRIKEIFAAHVVK